MAAGHQQHPFQHLVGRSLPGGSWSFTAQESRQLHDAVYSAPEHGTHPIMAFLAAQRGLGVPVEELFRLFGTEMSDGPMLTETVVDPAGDLHPGTRYEVRAEVLAVERKSGRTLGLFDLLTARFEVFAPGGGDPVAAVVNTYALPRRPAS
jgi:hypothetical protein